jgi:DNA-binding NtrC family response regulator
MFKYDWPGNIRQLEHCIESASVLCSDNIIREENLPPEIVKASSKTDISVPLGITLEEAEKIIIEQNLAANKGNKSKTAEILGIERKTLTNKLH